MQALPQVEESRSAASIGGPMAIPRLRLIILYVVLFLIAAGLGYPALNRYDPRAVPGLSDVQSYAAMVTGASVPGPDHMKFRVLIPSMARPLYRLAKGHVGSWDPVMLGLVAVDALFEAATALLIILLGTRILVSYPVALIGALLYLVNFAVPNMRLAGLVDAGEGFFLLAVYWCLSELEFWPLPFVAILGALTKETFVPFSIVFMAAWWAVMRKRVPRSSAAWIVGSCVSSFAAIGILHYVVSGHFENPVAFAETLRGNANYLAHFASSFLWDRNLLYVFVWLLPLGIPRLKRFPKSWLIPVAASCVVVFVLDGYYGGAPGTVGRALFSIAGPLLALSAAEFLAGFKAASPAC
jgi:hypothetical protein